MPNFLTVCLNPTFQRTLLLSKLETGEVNRAQESRLDASGKGINVSRVLSQLGGNTVNHLTHLGTGNKDFLTLCENDNFEVLWTSDPHSPIRTCITLLDQLQGATTELIEPTQPIQRETVNQIHKLFDSALHHADWVILSGSKAPGYPSLLFAEFCQKAQHAGVPVLADYRGDELAESLAFAPKVVKVNLVEFCATFLPELQPSEAQDSVERPRVEEHMKRLSSTGIDYVVTRGAREILWASQGESGSIHPSPIHPVNTIGCGDSMAAGIAHALAREASLVQAIEEGIRCASRNAQCLGPGTLE
ncbi:MAG: PfkB family carbohydrate kinase [Spirochaetales bacterium]|nr:PfkB family carbohydrate kinase [Spirochaetales bacterium]